MSLVRCRLSILKTSQCESTSWVERLSEIASRTVRGSETLYSSSVAPRCMLILVSYHFRFQTPYKEPPTNLNGSDYSFYDENSKSINTFMDAIDGSYCKYKNQSNPLGGELECGVFKATNVISISYGVEEHFYPQLWQQRQCNESVSPSFSRS